MYTTENEESPPEGRGTLMYKTTTANDKLLSSQTDQVK